MMKPLTPDLISMVRTARRQYRPGTGTVYDKLLRQAGPSAAWLAEELRSSCGVDTVKAEEVEPDFSILNSARANSWRCVVLRSRIDDVLRLGAEDPWDEALLHKASMYVGRPLTPAAVTFADLYRWLGRDGGIPLGDEAQEASASASPADSNADADGSARSCDGSRSAAPSSSGRDEALLLAPIDAQARLPSTMPRSSAQQAGAEADAALSRFPVSIPPASQRHLVQQHAQVSLVRTSDLDAQAPVARFADEAIATALAHGSSDIHFEFDRQGVTVKHRRDGVMTPIARLDGMQQAEDLIARIKALAKLDIAESGQPQGGSFRHRIQDSVVDLRVSVIPGQFGDDAVLRLLDKARRPRPPSRMALDALGLDPESARLIGELAAQPGGMLLFTGPACSGKTTTVYAAVSQINTGGEKIVSIEDPVEFELPGVLQIPVNERKGLTFARGVRSLLKHDPDRILVGEIRDAETAEIAVQSALTGRQVFATAHALSLTDILGRFRHFGIDMFGFMSSLDGVVMQRLVRRICPDCQATRGTTPQEREWLSSLGQHDLVRVPHAVGCSTCEGSGYRGRMAMAEVHLVDDTLRDMVTQGAAMAALKRYVYRDRVVPLAVQAVRRVLAGDTTLEEIRRVVGWL